MPEEATRKLLKLFGMALTDFEDQTKAALERLEALGSPAESAAPALEIAAGWLKANGEAMSRWLEVTQWLVETHAKGQAELSRVIAALRTTHEFGSLP
jgi:hypothetical protein